MKKIGSFYTQLLALIAFGAYFAPHDCARAETPKAVVKTVSARHHIVKRRIRRPLRNRHVKVLQCVGFIHQATDFQVRGNAKDWWNRAAEHNYERGHVPEPQAVLSFKPTRKMYLGHVALVRSVQDPRTILIDHSHWRSNGITRNVRVVDVSEKNDWTKVRVALNGNPEMLGSVYPTNGFIYPHFKSEYPEIKAEQVLTPTWHAPALDPTVMTALNDKIGNHVPPLNSLNVAENRKTLLSDGYIEEGPYRSL